MICHNMPPRLQRHHNPLSLVSPVTRISRRWIAPDRLTMEGISTITMCRHFNQCHSTLRGFLRFPACLHHLLHCRADPTRSQSLNHRQLLQNIMFDQDSAYKWAWNPCFFQGIDQLPLRFQNPGQSLLHHCARQNLNGLESHSCKAWNFCGWITKSSVKVMGRICDQPVLEESTGMKCLPASWV